eukprot:GEZU01004854.1.p1 GENE.GEZU01004854.1~~GEZU01004854.1.p1  ORF type:complete len:263 (-),score=27.70 GEZU01004854.1:36-824(-)
MTPCMFRKFALFLVLAGYRFSHCNQIHHSFRCYQTALHIYEGRQWDQIDEHMSITMGRLSTFMGNLQAAVNHIHQFMSQCKQPPEKQTNFLKEFLSIVKAYMNENPNVTEIKPLALPIIHDTTIKVLLGSSLVGDGGLYNSPLDSSVSSSSEAMWKEMEDGMMGSVRSSKGAFSMQPTYKKSQASVVRESIFVEVLVENPLQIPLDISDVKLTANFKKGETELPPARTIVGPIKEDTATTREQNGTNLETSSDGISLVYFPF